MSCGQVDLTPKKHFYKAFVIDFEKKKHVVKKAKVVHKIETEAEKFKPYYKKRDDLTNDPADRSNYCCDRVKINVTDDKPHAPFRDRDVCGLTYPHDFSSIWHECFMSGGLSWEMKLHFVHTLYPGRGEGEDIKWMKEEGIN